MKFLNEREMSDWAYRECKKGNDTEEIRKLITDSFWAYMYCYCIGHNNKLSKKISKHYHYHYNNLR